MASFPLALPTDADLFVAKDRSATNLTSGVDANTVTWPVASGAALVLYGIATCENEQAFITSINGQSLIVIRGVNGTAPAAHPPNATVRVQQAAAYHNRLSREVQAICGALGVGMSNVGGGALSSRRYDFAAIRPAASLAIGMDGLVTLPQVPLGVNWNNPVHWLYIVDAVAGDEAVTIKPTGPGTATSGGVNGTLTLTGITKNHAAGNWSLQSATAGVQEAIYAQAGAHAVYLPAGISVTHAEIYMPAGGYTLQGQGRESSFLEPAAGFPASYFVIRAESNLLMPGGALQDFAIKMPAQPDSTNLALYTQWTAIKWRGAVFSLIKNLRISGAYIGIDATANAGGSTFSGIISSNYNAGILAGSCADTVHIERFHHIPPLDHTANQEACFLANSVGIVASDALGWGNYLNISNSMSYARKFLVTANSNIQMAGIGCDSGGIEVGNSTVEIASSYFSIGEASYKAIDITSGSTVMITSTYIQKFAASAVPMISISTLGALMMSDCYMAAAGYDVPFVAVSSAGNRVMCQLDNNYFYRGGAFTQPIVSTDHAYGMLSITNNHVFVSTGPFVQFAAGSGSYAADGGFHVVANNDLGGETITYPTDTSRLQVYANVNAGNRGQKLRVDRLRLETYTFATLPADAAAGDMIVVSDGAVTSGANNTLAGGGTGALAVYLNGAWRAFNNQN